MPLFTLKSTQKTLFNKDTNKVSTDNEKAVKTKILSDIKENIVYCIVKSGYYTGVIANIDGNIRKNIQITRGKNNILLNLTAIRKALNLMNVFQIKKFKIISPLNLDFINEKFSYGNDEVDISISCRDLVERFNNIEVEFIKDNPYRLFDEIKEKLEEQICQR